MSRPRFDDIILLITFSNQPTTRPESVSSEEYRWMLVNDFIKNFNSHCANVVVPSGRLCIDESMIHWYGQGGHWINHGLPQYIAIERKPENGCKIQNIACAVSGIMIRLRLVKLQKTEEERNEINEEHLTHGTKVVKELVLPWHGSNQVVCADSYFALVTTAKEMMNVSLRFSGVVKTATKQYPMKWLSSVEMQNRGDMEGLVSKEQNQNTMHAFVWVDRER